MNCVAFKPDNPNIVVSASDDTTIKTWDITSGSCLSTLNVDGEVSSVAFSPSGSEIAAACNDYLANVYEGSFSVKILNTDTSAVLCTLSGHSNLVYSVAWSPDGTKLASGSADKTVRIWEAATGKQLWQLNVGSFVNSVHFSPDGHTVAAGCSNGTVQIIDVATAEVKRPLRGHRYAPSLSKECFLSFR